MNHETPDDPENLLSLARGGDGQALFDRSMQPGYSGLNAATTTVDHIAFEIGLADFHAEKSRLEQLGVSVETGTRLGTLAVAVRHRSRRQYGRTGVFRSSRGVS